MVDFSFALTDIEYFLLILVRISMFVYLAPFYGMKGVPNQVKIGLSFFVSVLLFHVTGPHEALPYNSVWGYAVIVAKEALTGLLISGVSAALMGSVTLIVGLFYGLLK